MAKGRKKKTERQRSKDEGTETVRVQNERPKNTTKRSQEIAQRNVQRSKQRARNSSQNVKIHHSAATYEIEFKGGDPLQTNVLSSSMLQQMDSTKHHKSPNSSSSSTTNSSSHNEKKRKKKKGRKNTKEKRGNKGAKGSETSNREIMMQSRGLDIVKEDLEKKISARANIQDLKRAGIIPKHGHVVDRFQKQLMKQNKQKQLNDFLKHRPPVGDLVRDSVMRDTMMWSCETQQGVVPAPRNCHTSIVVGDKMYLLGGYGTHGNASTSSELLILDLPSRTWSRPLVAGVVPIERYAHVCVAIDTNLVMFGGFSVDGNWMSDLNILDTNYKQDFFPSLGKYTDEQKTNRLEQMLMWWQPPVTGVPPSPRAAMSAVVHDRKIYFFGGNDDGVFFNDLHVLDTDQMHWIAPRCTGTPPSPRAGHTATLVGDRMVIFGGSTPDRPLNDIHFLDLTTMEWTEPQVFGTAPSRRAGHTVSLIYDTWLVVFGGGFLAKVNNDLHIFDTETCNWKRPSDAGIVPVQRGGHSCFSLDDNLYFFGGADVDGEVFNDLHILDTSFFRSRSSDLITIESGDSAPQNVHPAPPPVSQQKKKRSPRYVSELAETDELVEQIEHTTSDFRDKLTKVKEKISEQQQESHDQVQIMFQSLQDIHDKQFSILLEEVEEFEKIFIEKLTELKTSLQANILISRSRASSRSEFHTVIPTPPVVNVSAANVTQPSFTSSSRSPTPPNTRKNSDEGIEKTEDTHSKVQSIVERIESSVEKSIMQPKKHSKGKSRTKKSKSDARNGSNKVRNSGGSKRQENVDANVTEKIREIPRKDTKLPVRSFAEIARLNVK